HRGFDTGAVDYICKPIDPVLICSKVSVFLELEASKRKLEKALLNTRELENTKQAILNHSVESIVSIDENGRIEFANPAAFSLLGYNNHELIGAHVFSLLAPDLSSLHQWDSSNYCKSIQNLSLIREQNIRLYRQDGKSLNIDLSFGPYQAHNGRGGVFIFQDISERQKSEESLLFLATHDPLTHLPNRVMFRETVINSISRAKRYKHNLHLMFIDLDHFKRVNDELGHGAGDSLLKEVARRLKSVGRDVDVFARLGGDEFAVIFEDENNSFDTQIVADKLLNVLKQPFHFDGHEMHISASIGVVQYPEYGESADDLIKAADTAMYQAKQAGRNSYACFDRAQLDSQQQRSELKKEFREAVAQHQIQCFYQPILDANGELFSIEVLVRWQHPRLGLLEPKSFMPLAEDTGLVVELGYQVLTQAFDVLTRWQEAQLCSEKVKLSFNISSKQFYRKVIIADILRFKNETSFDLKRVIFEMTETTLLEDTSNVASIFNELKTLGIELCVDGYGSGYSSLKLLANLPLDYIKIDKSFIQQIKLNPKHDSIVRATVMFAHAVDMKVIAVGVESKATYNYLAEHGVDYVQGYLFAEP
ncbi:MAG: EAL domain-containing protein, partial [Pseudomonadales bacterium]